MKYYVNNKSGLVYSSEKLGLDEHEIPGSDWTEIKLSDDGLPEVVTDILE